MPTVVLRIGVGNNSAVIVNNILIANAVKNLITIDKIICNKSKDSIVPIKLIIKQHIPIYKNVMLFLNATCIHV